MLRAAIFLLCLLSLNAHLCAQTPSVVLRRANENSWVIRAVSTQDTLGPGRIRVISVDSVRIGQATVAIADIARIDREVRVGGGGSRGALLGGTGMGLFGLVLIHGFCRPDCSVMQIAGGAAMGATVGAAIGALVGGTATPSTRAWSQLWPEQ